MAYRWTFKKDPLKLEKILQAIHNQIWYVIDYGLSNTSLNFISDMEVTYHKDYHR